MSNEKEGGEERDPEVRMVWVGLEGGEKVGGDERDGLKI